MRKILNWTVVFVLEFNFLVSFGGWFLSYFRFFGYSFYVGRTTINSIATFLCLYIQLLVYFSYLLYNI